MALSGSVVTTSCEGRSVTLKWTATQSIDNNTSTIAWSLVGSGSAGGYVQVSEVRIKIDGTEVYYRDKDKHTNCYVDTVVCNGKTILKHKSDGTKSFTISVEAGIYEYAINCSGSGNFTLNTIARATVPAVSPTSVNMGSNITISMPRASSSFTHTLTYKCVNATGTIGTGLGTSKTWTVPLALANQIPKATSGTCTITCKTYNGSTLIGTKTVTFKAVVPSSIVPSISGIATSDTTGNFVKYGGYVQNKSKVKIGVTAAGAYSSTITAYKIVANGVTYTANNSTTEVLKTIGTNTISVTVTDSRGRTAKSSVTIDVIAYKSPTITTLKAVRCNADGTDNEEGDYFRATIEASITALNDINAKSFALQYKEPSTYSWTTVATYTDSYSISESVIAEANKDKTYDVQLVATDDFATTTKVIELASAYTLIDFNKSGKGISFGRVSEADGFDCDLETRFRQAVRSDADVIANMGGTNQVSLTGLNESIQGKITSISSGLENSFTGNIAVHDVGEHRDLQVYLIAGKALSAGTWYDVYTFSRKPLSTCRAVVVANTNTFIPVVVELQSTGLLRIYPRVAMAKGNDIRFTLSFAT